MRWFISVLCFVPIWASAQTLPQVYQQAPGDNYVVFEAENYHVLSPGTVGSLLWQSVGDPDAQGGRMLTAPVPVLLPGVGGANKAGGLERCKAQYNIQFVTPGAYYIYMRVRRNSIPTALVNLFFSGSFNGHPAASPNSIPPLNALPNYKWEKISNTPLSIADVDRLHTFTIRPRGTTLNVDAIILSTNANLTLPQINAIAAAPTPEAESTVPANLLRYTLFDGLFSDYPVDDILTQQVTFPDVTSISPGRSLALRGTHYAYLNTAPPAANPVLAFSPIEIDCGYTTLSFCYSHYAPNDDLDAFDFGDFLRASATFYDNLDNFVGISFHDIDAATLNASPNAYMHRCLEVASIPVGAKTVRFSLELVSGDALEDLFIDEVYVQATGIPPAPQLNLSVDASSSLVLFDASASTNAALFDYDFGDGLPPTGPTDIDLVPYFYLPGFIYIACVSALDACGNQPDVSCVEIDLLAPLPVDWQTFVARPDKNGVQLNWTTAGERHNAWFEVERSTDGRRFASIGRVLSQGDSQTAQHYTFFDPTPARGHNYYRLRQVDWGGAFGYSQVAQVWFDAASASVGVFPNPVINRIGISGLVAPTPYTLYNAQGQRLREGITAGEIDQLDLLPAGLYFLELTPTAQQPPLRLPLLKQ